MREGVNLRCVNGKQGIEEIGQADAVGFGNETEQGTVSVEAPGMPSRSDVDCRLTIAVKKFTAKPSCSIFIG
jgi:hypothetical protein